MRACWLNALGATVNRFTVCTQIRLFVMAVTAVQQLHTSYRLLFSDRRSDHYERCAQPNEPVDRMTAARELTDSELAAVSGGISKVEAQILQALSDAIGEVVKNIGGALQTAARGG